MNLKKIPILKVEAPGNVELSKGAVMFLVNGGIIPHHKVFVTISYLEKDEQGKTINKTIVIGIQRLIIEYKKLE